MSLPKLKPIGTLPNTGDRVYDIIYCIEGKVLRVEHFHFAHGSFRTWYVEWKERASTHAYDAGQFFYGPTRVIDNPPKSDWEEDFEFV